MASVVKPRKPHNLSPRIPSIGDILRLAHAELAIAYLLGILDITNIEAAASAAPHVTKAMMLDPSLAEVHAAAGTLSMNEGDLQGALEHFQKAIEINPNYADVYYVDGKHFGRCAGTLCRGLCNARKSRAVGSPFNGGYSQ
jgi:tetratricopeptide (TPR) repeat protein